MVFPSYFKFDGNFVSLSPRLLYHDSYKMLYMARQLCCRGMCKNLLRSGGQPRNYGNTKFPPNLNCGQKNISETGPRTTVVLQGLRFNRLPLASFTKEVKLWSSKCPLLINGRLANRRLTSLVKEATCVQHTALSSTIKLMGECKGHINYRVSQGNYAYHVNENFFPIRILWDANRSHI